MSYNIEYVGEGTDVHHLGISCDGIYYTVIFGRYINGGFCCIPNHNAGCELSGDLQDQLWNAESLTKALQDKKAAAAIAEAIAEYVAELMEEEHEE